MSNSENTSTSSNITNTNNTTINNTPSNNLKQNKGPEILPANTDSNDKYSKCPPCPACDRCPEPAFTCEKVVNYRSPSSSQYLPIPVLNDFSSFPSA